VGRSLTFDARAVRKRRRKGGKSGEQRANKKREGRRALEKKGEQWGRKERATKILQGSRAVS
jgi:hypothetical protein